jgi:hypothetical protein
MTPRVVELIVGVAPPGEPGAGVPADEAASHPNW